MVRQKNKTHTVTYSGPCALQWYDNKNKTHTMTYSSPCTLQWYDNKNKNTHCDLLRPLRAAMV